MQPEANDIEQLLNGSNCIMVREFLMFTLKEDMAEDSPALKKKVKTMVNMVLKMTVMFTFEAFRGAWNVSLLLSVTVPGQGRL